MKANYFSLLALSTVFLMGSCATSNQTVQQVDQNDDVYYSEARAKEKVEVIAQAAPEPSKRSDYVTDEELYGDVYGSYGGYAQRISRFRNYVPWRGYYSDVYRYGYNDIYAYGNPYSSLYSYYDPFYQPYNSFSVRNINIFVGNGGYYGYNPWRYYGSNYTGNFWGTTSYYNPYGVGFGGYGNNGYYGNGYGNGRPTYTSANYRPRPVRGSDGLPVDPGAVNGGNAGGVIRNGNNGNVIQTDQSRAGRYNGGSSSTPATTTGTTRPTTTSPRPERVSQQPQRSTQPERVNTSPPPSNSGSGRSSDGGGSSSGGSSARPSRGN